MPEIRYCPEIATLLIGLHPLVMDLESNRDFAGSLGLTQKPEFHVTIIGNNTGQELMDSLQNLPLSEKCERLVEIGELAESFNWNITLKPDMYAIEKVYPDGELRTSIIQVAECDDVAPFYQRLGELTGMNFDLPYLHATLFTNSTDERNTHTGIGIYSNEDFKSLNPQKL